ncbi:hypothetical protein K443DRAFT_9352 [Laccaria amethystina LaAM-08-1]|uniref:Uncharacterized protein n=1 Tax=Laccaria amethystina LaAM-08-1 TaxID=1095629 RepID=A0A0C9X9P6_9AGAR|nr:hypothetical protein K443DRAFT_9352 [Laccaria amethystina LaAM-08-1]
MPGTHIHPNGAAEICFQFPQDTSNAQGEPQAVQSVGVSEVAMPLQDFTIPTPDSPSNPFISTDSLPHGEGFLHHPHPPRSPSEESFAEPSPSHSVSGSPSPRSCGSPRAGRHSTANPSPSQSSTTNPSGPTRTARNNRKKGAPDVRTFFKIENEKQVCAFCEHQHSIDPTYEVFGFSRETGTSSLRAHLMKFHLGQWVDGCD